MKVFLLKDVEKVGMAHEIIKVTDGYALNFLFPRKLAVEVKDENMSFFKNRSKTVEKRNEVIATKTTMQAERIKSLTISIAKRLHDDGKLYGSIKEAEVVELLNKQGVPVKKSQIDFGKTSIKSKGSYEVTVHLSSDLHPKFTLNVISE